MQRRISEYVDWCRYAAGAVDAHGNPADSWDAPVPVGVYAVNPGTTGDVELAGADRDVSAPSLYAPLSVVMGARDRVIARGGLYEVDGATRVFRNPFGSGMDGNQIDLKRVEG